MDYVDHKTYIGHVAAQAKFLATPSSFTFSNYFYKGLSVGNQCSAWRTYKDNTLSLPFDDIKFLKVTARVDYFNFASNTNRSVVATCTSPNLIQSMITSLRTGDALEVNCNDRTWRVFSCQGNVVFCVNCKKVCVETEYCPGTAFVVNPCSSCKTRAAASTIANFEYGLLKLYPQFSLPLKVIFSVVCS
jgi:hypothetical protein